MFSLNYTSIKSGDTGESAFSLPRFAGASIAAGLVCRGQNVERCSLW